MSYQDLYNLINMKSPTYKDLYELIDNIGFDAFGNEYYDRSDLKGADIKFIERKNDGDEVEMIYVCENIYFAISGYYSSYDGSRFDAMHEVRPMQKTITVYPRVENNNNR